MHNASLLRVLQPSHMEKPHNQNTPIYLQLATYTDLSGCSGHPTVRHASEACQSTQQGNKHQDRLKGQSTYFMTNKHQDRLIGQSTYFMTEDKESLLLFTLYWG